VNQFKSALPALSKRRLIDDLLREAQFNTGGTWGSGSEEMSIEGRLFSGSLMQRISPVEFFSIFTEGMDQAGDSWSGFRGCCEGPAHEADGDQGEGDVKTFLFHGQSEEVDIEEVNRVMSRSSHR
jgi:hypothetical protein